MLILPTNINQILEAFEKWYKSDYHKNNEDYYSDTLTLENLSGMSKKEFEDFFLEFANEGGRIQSGGYRTAGNLLKAVHDDYRSFKSKIIEPFNNDFDVYNWLNWAKDFPYFGKGIATIFLNRLNKTKFAVVNNKSIEAYEMLGYTIKRNPLEKTYEDIYNAQTDFIKRFPEIKNYYKADALSQFIIGEEEGINLINSSIVNYWIFQGNPKFYKVVEALNDNALVTWSVKAFKKTIKKGDKVILWVTGEKPGCYALCEVTSDVYEGMDEKFELKYYTDLSTNEISSKVKIKVTHNLASKPITKAQIDSINELSDLKVGNQGTNFSATKEQYLTLLNMTENINSKKYWLYSPGEKAEMWDEFYEKGIMGIGWDTAGDLNKYKTKRDIEIKLQQLEKTDGSKKNDATALYELKEIISIGDIIIVKKGRGELLGFGEVVSDYYYDSTREDYRQIRKVDWKKKGNWKTDHSLALKTLTDITKYSSDHPDYDFYYQRLLGIMGINGMAPISMPLNMILYGPPGTGKTYNTLFKAAAIIEERLIPDIDEAKRIFNEHLGNRIEFITFHQNYSYEDFIQGIKPDTENDKELTFEKRDGIFKKIADRALNNLKAADQPQSIKRPFEEVFQEFINPLVEGDVEKIELRMKKVSCFITNVANKSIEFEKATGKSSHTLSISTLKKMYEAESVLDIQGLASYYMPLLNKLLELGKKNVNTTLNIQKQNYIIIIDEINRANISRVFGELITLIEPDKRSHGNIPLKCKLPSGEEFMVPSNLYILGTMNTADKSIALIDVALRRRFQFIGFYPDYTLIPDFAEILKPINERIYKEKNSADFMIGHSFFMNHTKNDLQEIFNNAVIPLLFEYFNGNINKITEILKAGKIEVEETENHQLIYKG
jgi:hypothetical protein